MKAMLLAAGLGTRLRPVTNHYAKPALPLLNVPLIFWGLEFLNELAPQSVVANLHYLPDTIRALAPRIQKSGFEIRFTHEVAAPLGSGGALWFARKELEDSETLVVANADEVILPLNRTTLGRMRAQHESTGALATLLTMRHPGAGTEFGAVWVDDNHHVHGFGREREKFPLATTPLHYVGLIMLNARIFKYLPEGESNLLYDAVQKGISSGERVAAFEEKLVWFETGNPKDFLHATRELLPFISSRAEDSFASDLAQRAVARHSDRDTRLWESHSGACLLASNYAPGSLEESEICRALEKEKAFAVIGANALIENSVLNSVVFPGATVSKASPCRDALVLPT